MKPVRWTAHALASLVDREIDRWEADRTVSAPDQTATSYGGRQVLMRRFHDTACGQEMVPCVVTEDHATETVAVTAYKTSKFAKYLDRGAL